MPPGFAFARHRQPAPPPRHRLPFDAPPAPPPSYASITAARWRFDATEAFAARAAVRHCRLRAASRQLITDTPAAAAIVDSQPRLAIAPAARAQLIRAACARCPFSAAAPLNAPQPPAPAADASRFARALSADAAATPPDAPYFIALPPMHAICLIAPAMLAADFAAAFARSRFHRDTPPCRVPPFYLTQILIRRRRAVHAATPPPPLQRRFAAAAATLSAPVFAASPMPAMSFAAPLPPPIFIRRFHFADTRRSRQRADDATPCRIRRHAIADWLYVSERQLLRRQRAFFIAFISDTPMPRHADEPFSRRQPMPPP